MASQGTFPQEKLSEYIKAVGSVNNHDEWWSHFIEVARCVPDLQISDLRPEKQVHEGREYALLGNLVFQYKRDLHKRWGDDNQSLRRFIGSLKARYPQTAFTAVTTSGLAFHVYSPQLDEAGRVTDLESVAGLNLSSPMMAPEQALRDLGDILSHCRD